MSLVNHDPAAMTTRARWYLGAAAFRHGVIGVALLVAPWLFGAATFIPVFGAIPLIYWGIFMTIDGLACGIAAITRQPTVARYAVMASAVITLVLAAGLWIGVTVVWRGWVEIVGPHELWYLIGNPPAELPARLLMMAPAPPSPFLPVVMTALSVKDFAVCAQPLRSPFEHPTLVRRAVRG